MSQLQTKKQAAHTAGSDETQSGRTYGGQSREQRQAQRRQQFLDAGLEVFGTEGFRLATVRSICRTAQLTDRYFYEEFGNLEGLLQAVYCDCMDRIYQQLMAELAQLSAGDSMREVVESSLEVFFAELEDPRVARVCMLELEGVSAGTDTLYLGYIRRFALLLMSMSRRAYPHWQLQDDEAELLGTGLVGAVRQISTSWLMSGHSHSRRLMVQTGSRIILGLIHQLQQEADQQRSDN